jgi:hypothetical protein
MVEYCHTLFSGVHPTPACPLAYHSWHVTQSPTRQLAEPVVSAATTIATSLKLVISKDSLRLIIEQLLSDYKPTAPATNLSILQGITNSTTSVPLLRASRIDSEKRGCNSTSGQLRLSC